MANRGVCDVQNCTLKQSNGSAFIGIKFLTALFLLSRRTIKSHLLVMGKREQQREVKKKKALKVVVKERKT